LNETPHIAVAETPSQLELCYDIRRAVFVGEQGVPLELELDDKDAVATHFLMTSAEGGAAVGTARFYEKDSAAKIGRVAILRESRGRGFGALLMSAVLAEARRQGYRRAMLDSQTYAIPFYERLGFAAEGPEFDDAGIPHRRMYLTIDTAREG
jgi:ElaA protein